MSGTPPHAHDGSMTWCAKRRDDPDLTHIIRADTPGHLDEYLTEAGATPPGGTSPE
jgi:hypothetical protein